MGFAIRRCGSGSDATLPLVRVRLVAGVPRLGRRREMDNGCIGLLHGQYNLPAYPAKGPARRWGDGHQPGAATCRIQVASWVMTYVHAEGLSHVSLFRIPGRDQLSQRSILLAGFAAPMLQVTVICPPRNLASVHGFPGHRPANNLVACLHRLARSIAKQLRRTLYV